MGKISINKLRLLCHHGVMEQERKVGNIFEFTIVLDVPSSEKAMQSDNLADTINYARVVEIVKNEMRTPCKLIEAAAGKIIAALQKEFPGQIEHGDITISKLAPPISAEMESVGYTASF